MRTLRLPPWVVLAIGACVWGTASAQADNGFLASLELNLGAVMPSLVGATLVQDAPPPEIAATSAPQDAGALARQIQNPVADLISLPLQNNTSFNVGFDNEIRNVLNIQPIIPVTVGDWHLINRIIMPVVYQPAIAPGLSSEFGLGDTNYTLFFSPAAAQSVIWGVGPSLDIPTATANALGTGQWNLGPSAVVLTMPDPWVIGGLWQHLWTLGGDSNRPNINRTLVQYFVNYNLDGGWYLTSAPIITGDWNAPSGEDWVVPFGGGFGKIFRIGDQPMNASFQAFYNVVDTTASGDWSIRFQLQFLFPK